MNTDEPYDQLTPEIAQLCKIILIFQNSIQPTRQTLFTKYSITDDLAWNVMFGGIQQASSNQFYAWTTRGKSKISNEECQSLIRRYSQAGDQKIRKLDMWRMFKPKQITCFDKIMSMKKSTSVMPKLVEIDFRAKQLMISIIEKTMQFEKCAEQMRRNILLHQDQFQSFRLKELESKYLQLYLIQYIPSIRMKECDIIMEHIMGNNKNQEKSFYTFFIPLKCKQSKTNPIESIKLDEKLDASLKLYKNSRTVWDYGKNYAQHNKPLYLSK